MFNTSITLAGDSASTRNYDLRSIEGGKSIRANASAASNELEALTISHSQNTLKDGTKVKRHLVRLDLTKVNATSGKAFNAAVYAVIEQPIDSVITTALLKDMRTQLKNFLDDGNTLKVINDEP
jgi:hypothetical protein